MKVNVKKTRRITLLLAMIMAFSMVFAACVNTNDVPEIIDTSMMLEESSEFIEESDDVIETPEGHTDAPSIDGMVNIAPTKVALYGKCEAGATIRVAGGKEDAETIAHGEYYIVEVDIWDRNTLLYVTAQIEDELDENGEVVKEGKLESLPREIVAHKDATADTLLDGNSVSVGVNSLLYFDKVVYDVNGNNLYTASQLNKIRDYVTDTVTSYYNDRAGTQDVELIYVLVPNSTTIYPEILPEDVVNPANTTVYEQIANTLAQTRATVIDMKPILEAAAKDPAVLEKYGKIYRETDSSLSDYGAYLTYSEILKKISVAYPDAAPRTEEEFTWNKLLVNGGNLVNYREIDGEVIQEEAVFFTPNFSLDIGTDVTGSSKISSLVKYVDTEDNDYNFFLNTNANDGINGIAERWLIDDTTRTDVDLPSALIYRDYSAVAFSDILAERFGKCLLGKVGELSINLSATAQYAQDGDNVVDYIVVIISEENLDSAFSLAFS